MGIAVIPLDYRSWRSSHQATIHYVYTLFFIKYTMYHRKASFFDVFFAFLAIPNLYYTNLFS
jgi:hypothetical protein